MVLTQEEVVFNTMVNFYSVELTKISKGGKPKTFFDKYILADLIYRGLLRTLPLSRKKRQVGLTHRTKKVLKEIA